MDKPRNNNPGQGARPSGPARPKKKKRSAAATFFRGFGLVFITIVLIGMTTAAICAMAFGVYINKYITPEVYIDLAQFQLKETSFIYYYDENGNEVQLQKLHGGEDRVWTEIKDIPKKLQLAFISIEDNTFYTHKGVSWRRTLGAGLDFVVGIDGFKGGGSTITQQLIKNLTGDDETSVTRKLQEIMRALELEKNYEKDEILEMYLNTIFFGQNAYGVKQAAQTYFDKELDQLSIAECAAIAGIIKNPYKYDLFRFPEENEKRRKVVLGTMLEYENITQAEYDKAVAEKVVAVRSADDEDFGDEVFQSYYVDAVIDQVLKDIKDDLGYASDVAASKFLFNGGLKIYIPIDMALQDKMDAVFKDVENFPGDLGKDGTYPQAGMVLMDPQTGYVLALYGGRGEKYGNRMWNHATMSKRQPGSAIKPLTVYAPAIEYGLITPITVLDDTPKSFVVSEQGWPKNENRKYSGRCTIFRGIGSSLNTIAVDIVEQLGYDRAFNFAKTNMHLDSLISSLTVTNKDGSTRVHSDIDVSPMALGGLTKGLSVMEMTAAYATFVNNGYYSEPILYTKVVDSNGDVILENAPAVGLEPVMSPRTRDYMIDLLTYVTQSGTGTKARIEGVEVGGKTGTTSDDNDRWFAGITPHYAAVVWFGYETPQSLQKFSTNPSLELWHRVMESIYAEVDMEAEGYQAKFSRLLESEYTSVTYCMDSGLLATDACKNDYRGSSRAATAKILKADVPTQECNLHMLMEIDINTGGIANDFCPSAEGARGLRGVLVFRRAYPYSGVAVADQEWVLDYDLTELEIMEGMHKPTTPSKITDCPVHNIFNDGNITDPPPEDLDEWGNPIDPDQPDPWEVTEPPEGGNPPEVDPPTTVPDTTVGEETTSTTGPPTNFF